MIIYTDIVQGSPRWHKIRSGKPTSSCFSDIVTPKTLERSKSASGYEDKCVAEILLGISIEEFGGTRATERGKQLEPEAFQFYEMMFSANLTHVGFVSDDAGTVGASPDACELTEDGKGFKRIVELKCGGAEKHIGFLLNPKSLYEAHKAQCQGTIEVCRPEVYDIMHYYPGLYPAVYRVERDEEYISKLNAELSKFNENVQTKLAKIRGMS